MAYLVNKTNGELLASVLDGQTNATASSIVLIGKQVTNYGEIQNENFVRIMENFANGTDPAHPITGQLWWNTTSKSMQVFDGTNWRPATGFTGSATSPLAAYVGDQWWDTTNQQYKVYNGTDWTLIGPAYSVLDGTSGALVENIYDTSAGKHTVIKLYNNGNVTAIISRDVTFTPNVAISGFSTVNPGITLTNAVGATKVYGTATNADTLGNLTPAQYLRSDVDTVAAGRVSIHNQLDVGPANELNIFAAGGVTYVRNTIANGDIRIRANVGGTEQTAIAIAGASGLASVYGNPTSALGIVPKQYADALDAQQRTDTSNYLAANVGVLSSAIAGVQSNVDTANSNISSLQALKAPLASPALTGVPTSPTAAPGTANTQIATTGFVANAISIFDSTQIYNGTSFVKVNTANIMLVASGTTLATVTPTGITTVTQSANDNSTNIATTAYVDRGDKNFVRNSVRYQPTCYISDQPPNNAVGIDGDIWFQYT